MRRRETGEEKRVEERRDGKRGKERRGGEGGRGEESRREKGKREGEEKRSEERREKGRRGEGPDLRTLHVGQSNEQVCPHLHSESCGQAVIILDADHLADRVRGEE